MEQRRSPEAGLLLPGDADEELRTSHLWQWTSMLDRGQYETRGVQRFYIILATMLSYASPILPAFLRPGGFDKYEKQSSTAYLDGLRGWAACIVVFYHFSQSNPHPTLARLPFLNALTAGSGMVTVFFAISGYVLSHRLLKHMRSKDFTRLLDSLASSMFRRYFRLYLPTAFASCVGMLLVRLHFPTDGSDHRFSTLGAQFWDWVKDVVRSSDPFHDVVPHWHPGLYRNRYCGQMWTIPIEFRASMILFGFSALCCRMPSRTRMITTVITIAISFYAQAFHVALFLGGMLVADMSLGRKHVQVPGTEKTGPANRHSLREHIGYCTVFAMALLLLGTPTRLESTSPFPWNHLHGHCPHHWNKFAPAWFFLSLGALLLIFAVDGYRPLQIPFEWRLSQYVGDLCFGIYAMHMYVLTILGLPIISLWMKHHIGYGLATDLLTMIPIYCVVLWVADYFTIFDRRIVAFGRWLQNKTFS